jgi:DNA-binding IclR family transcriptional regulator
MSDEGGRTVGSVARALALLDALAEGPAGVNALARRIGVNPSSASRLLATLEHGGLVEREPGGPYRLGLHLVALADRVLARLDVRELARPQLRALVEATGETATLSVADGDLAVTVDFDDVDGYLAYRDHPHHKQFIADLIAGKVADRAAVQFETP